MDFHTGIPEAGIVECCISFRLYRRPYVYKHVCACTVHVVDAHTNMINAQCIHILHTYIYTHAVTEDTYRQVRYTVYTYVRIRPH